MPPAAAAAATTTTPADEAAATTRSTTATTTTIPKKPKRPLTAYNCYFKEQRTKILSERHTPQYDVRNSDWKRRKGRSKPHGKIKFQELGKMIGARWAQLTAVERGVYEARAAQDKERYREEMEVYKQLVQERLEEQRAALEATVAEDVKQHYFSGAPPDEDDDHYG